MSSTIKNDAAYSPAEAVEDEEMLEEDDDDIPCSFRTCESGNVYNGAEVVSDAPSCEQGNRRLTTCTELTETSNLLDSSVDTANNTNGGSPGRVGFHLPDEEEVSEDDFSDDVKSDPPDTNILDESYHDEDDTDNELPHDSFSMLFASKTVKEHMLPLGVFGLQILILILILINLLQTSDRPLATAMNVPVDVPLTVKMSQVR